MKVTKLLLDPEAMRDGAWQVPVPDEPGFRVRARCRTPEFADRQRRRNEDLMTLHGTRVPFEAQRRSDAELIFEECVVDFEGLEDHDGQPMTRERALELCGTFAGQPLYIAFLAAINLSDNRRAADSERARGNSSAASAAS